MQPAAHAGIVPKLSRDPHGARCTERIENRRAFIGKSFERLVVRYAERLALRLGILRAGAAQRKSLGVI
jgi:hypothetical protein